MIAENPILTDIIKTTIGFVLQKTMHVFEQMFHKLNWNEQLGDRLLWRGGGEWMSNPYACSAQCAFVHRKRDGSMRRRFSRRSACKRCWIQHQFSFIALIITDIEHR